MICDIGHRCSRCENNAHDSPLAASCPGWPVASVSHFLLSLTPPGGSFLACRCGLTGRALPFFAGFPSNLPPSFSDGGDTSSLHLPLSPGRNDSQHGARAMDDGPCRLFFTAPSCPAQRQYEALRAVFVEGLSQKEAAERFG